MGGASSLAAGTRADRIRDRIEAVAGDPAIATDTVRKVEAEGMTNIMAGDRPLMSVIDADARLEQVERTELANLHLQRIRKAIADYREARSPDALRQGAVYSAGATVVLALALALLIWLARRLDRLLERRVQSRIRSLSVQSFEFVRGERIGAALRGIVRGLEALAILAMGLAYLDFGLSQFPWTRPTSKHLLDLVLGPLATIGKAVLSKVPDLIFLAILFFVFSFVVRVAQGTPEEVVACKTSHTGCFLRDILGCRESTLAKARRSGYDRRRACLHLREDHPLFDEGRIGDKPQTESCFLKIRDRRDACPTDSPATRSPSPSP